MVSSQNASRFLNKNEGSTIDTARVSKGEDLSEVSSQLRFLRKHHDANKTINSIRIRALTAKSFDLQIVQDNGKNTTNKLQDSKDRVNVLELEINNIKKSQDESTLDTFSYKHVLDRMQSSRLHLDMKSLNLNKYIKVNQHVLGQEIDKKRRVREARIQTKVAVRNLEKFITRETKEKYEELQGIEKDVKQKKESNQRREEGFRRQIEILEVAADEDRNMKAMQLREGLLLHMFWYFVLQKRLLITMNKFSKLEAAFNNVKKTTGMYETSEIIEKLLTKEAGYVEILENIKYTKIKIEDYSNKNKDMEEKLNLINIIKAENIINPVKSLELNVKNKTRELEIQREKLQGIRGTYINISTWCNKITNMLKKYSNSSNDSVFATLVIENLQSKPMGKLSDEIIELKEEIFQCLQHCRSNVMNI